MSFINFLGLSDETYGDYAKGILYVICEIITKLIHAVGTLLDVIAGLFYKITGANYAGSGSGALVEEQDFKFIRLQFTDIFGILKNIALGGIYMIIVIIAPKK